MGSPATTVFAPLPPTFYLLHGNSLSTLTLSVPTLPPFPREGILVLVAPLNFLSRTAWDPYSASLISGKGLSRVDSARGSIYIEAVLGPSPDTEREARTVHINELSSPQSHATFPEISHQIGNALSSPPVVTDTSEWTLITYQGTRTEVFGPAPGCCRIHNYQLGILGLQ